MSEEVVSTLSQCVAMLALICALHVLSVLAWQYVRCARHASKIANYDTYPLYGNDNDSCAYSRRQRDRGFGIFLEHLFKDERRASQAKKSGGGKHSRQEFWLTRC